MTSSRPTVAMISERKCAGVARCFAEMLIAAWANMRLAAMAPVRQSATWAGRYAPASAQASPPKAASGERHCGVEMTPGHRAEHQDDRVQPGGGGGGVLEQLQAGV